MKIISLEMVMHGFFLMKYRCLKITEISETQTTTNRY